MPLDISRIKALCFDVDGTLRDTDNHYEDRLVRLMKPFYRLTPRRNIRTAARRVVMTLDTPLNAVYTALDWIHLDATVIGVLDRFNEFKLRPSKDSLPLISGTLPSLDELGKVYPLSIVSARGEAGTMEFLVHHDLDHRFVCIASGQTTRHTKPWPDPVLWCAEKIGVPPEACLMIGDTTVDIRAGKLAGAQSVGVLSGFGSPKELARAGADLIVDDVAALTNILLAN